jgi:uracil-DNA glycosylase
MGVKILPNYIHNSWNDFLSKEIIENIKNIENEIENIDFTPKSENILRFLKNDLQSIKIIILGQDPYPEKGRATGRSFEVGDLNSWQDKFKQISLKNIIRLIHKSYKNIENYSDIKSYTNIKKDIVSGEFKILQPDEIFKSWENQGVLLLNKSLTCEVGKPGSHRNLWNDFSKELISYISSKNNIHWFLWGNDAISNEKYIQNGTLHKSKHPMMCSEKYENDFLKSMCFIKTKNLINWLG